MDFNFDGIISDKYEWSLVDKAIHDEVVRLRERVSHLEIKYIGDDEPTPKLYVIELAKVIMNYDTAICPFCEKGGRVEYHQELCPFTFASQVLTPPDETDVRDGQNLAKMLGIDNAVRWVAQSGKNHDQGPNWYAKWGGMNFAATFGAGTNSASVRVETAEEGGHLDNEKLYGASDYGHHIETFRNGPWVHRLLNWASILQANNEGEAERVKAKQEEAQSLKFKKVDF